MQKSYKLKKAVSITVTVLSVLIFVFALCVFAVTMYAKSSGKQATLFGYSFSIVQTGSMVPEINVGELVVVKHCAIEEAQIGDNVVYLSDGAEYPQLKGQRIIHKVVEKNEDALTLRTQGVANATPDRQVIDAQSFVGIGVAHSAFWGAIIGFFSNTWNWIFLAVFLFGIWLGVRQIKKLVSYTKEGAEEAPDETKKE